MLLPTLLALVGVTILTPDAADPARVVAEASGAPRGSKISLHLVDAVSGELGPAIFARVEKTEAGLRLTPSFGLTRGATYRAVLRPPEGEPVSTEHRIPAAKAATAPEVEKIYPTAEKLPANLLKFYLYFSEPMRESRDVFDQIHIENEQGERVRDPWRRRELWSDNAKRLTVWIHPGRIKRGVNLREELGPVLRPNRRYTLVIDKTLRGAAGIEIGREIRHEFSTLPEDHERPLPETWKLTVPKAETRGPLKIESPEPLDHILIGRHLTVVDAAGEEKTVEFEIAPGEKTWSITPEEAWKSGRHQLVIGEFLEDLAGNTRLRVFDTDLTRPVPKPGAAVLEFEPDS